MIGQTLLHYRIMEKLGEGGMGVVYKAHDAHLDRYVAIKVLPHEKTADPDRRRRFVQEAKAASALNHPNIITIHDIDEVADTHFIAMEYVRGKTLRELIDNKELQLSQILDYAAQIASALYKAHSAGIVHRDLKPSNVMITPEGLVKVLDFGLAKLTESPATPGSAGERSILPTLGEAETTAGIIMGTLPYMSPEQARGLEVDHRTDIFSLGVVLYQMVAGELPFSGPHAVAVLDKLLYSPTPSLKARFPDIPVSLEQAITRATAKDPCDRYQSMKELIVDLQSPRGTPEPAAAGQAGLQREKGNRRFGRLLAAFGAALVLLVLLLALPFHGWLPRWLGGPALPSQMRLAVLPFSNVGAGMDNGAVCDGLAEILATKLIQVGQFQNTLNVVPTSEVRTEKITSASRARRMFGANLVLTGSVQRLADKILLTINLVDTATLRQIDGKVCMAGAGEWLTLEDDIFESAVAMLALKVNPTARQALSAGQTQVRVAYNSYLQAIGYLARYDIAENVDKAIELFQQAVREDPQYALAHAGLGEACWRKFWRTKENKWADAALTSCLRAAELDSRVARVHMTLGMVYTGIGRPEKAVNELNRAIAMEPRNSDDYRELGRAFEAMNKTDDAENSYHKAIQLQPDSWSCIWNLGVFYYNRAKYEQAATQFLEVIRLAPDHFRAHSSLGAIYIYQGKFAQAAEMLNKSLAIRASSDAYSNLGALYILQRRFSEAVAVLEKATGMVSSRYEAWGNLADAYSQTPGLSAKAPDAYARAVELARRELEVNSKDSAAGASLAFYLMRLGDKRKALEEIRKAGALSPNDQDVLFWTALVYEAAGNREKALNALAAAAAGGYSLAVIRAAFDLDKLREDPRYLDRVEHLSRR